MTEIEVPDVISIFYCYDRSDKALRDGLEKHLKVLRQLDFIESWSNLDVHAGSEHDLTIEKYLQAADIILVLISASFLASEYNSTVLMDQILKRHDAGEAIAIFIPLRSVAWKDSVARKDNRLRELIILPSSEKPVTAWSRRDAAFEDIIKGLHKILKDVWLKKGDAHYRAKRYEQAYRAFDKAILQNPFFAPAHTRKGCALHNLGDDQYAMSSFENAIVSNPRYAYARYLKGTLHYHLTDYEQARSSLAEAIQLDPALTSAHIYMGLALEKQGNIEGAIAVYKGYLELHPHDPLITYFQRDLLNRSVSKEFQKEMQRMGEQFLASLDRFYRNSGYRPSGIEETPIMAFMRAFRNLIHEFQAFGRHFAERYYGFLDHLRVTLFPIIDTCNIIENAEIRYLLLNILDKEKALLEVRTNFIKFITEYLRDLEHRGINEMDTIINEWDAALERIILELEAQHHQSQNLLNTLQERETENLFQINAEDQ